MNEFGKKIKEDAEKYNHAVNHRRLTKWLAKKQTEIKKIEADITDMLADCERGDYSRLPDLEKTETKDVGKIFWGADYAKALASFEQYSYTTSTTSNTA